MTGGLYNLGSTLSTGNIWLGRAGGLHLRSKATGFDFHAGHVYKSWVKIYTYCPWPPGSDECLENKPYAWVAEMLVITIDGLEHLNRIITAHWEGLGDVGSARYELAPLPPCLTIRVLSCSNCQRSIHSTSKWIFRNVALYVCSAFTWGIIHYSGLHSYIRESKQLGDYIYIYISCLNALVVYFGQ